MEPKGDGRVWRLVPGTIARKINVLQGAADGWGYKSMKQPHMQVAQVLMKGAGFYSWCLRENSLTADKAFAQIYEINEGELARGVPVEFILERIVEEDRPRLAARIHEVILGGEPLVSPYAIECPSGRRKSLLSMGSCSRDLDNLPSIYSGVVLIEQTAETKLETSHLESQITSAIKIARNAGLELTERYLFSALRSMSSSELQT